MTRPERERELQNREQATAAVRKADETTLAKLRGMSERGETLPPDRARALVASVVGSALASTDHDPASLALLVNKTQEGAPEAYGDVVTAMVRGGYLQVMLGRGADPAVVQMAMVLRAQLVCELRLETCDEFTVLDTALRHWIEGREAMARAQRTNKPSDYARLVQVAQAADKVFAGMVQQLRVRHQPRVSALHVDHATNLAVQVNQGGQPVGRDANRVTCGPPRQVADVPAEGTDPYLFDKN
jgi:hypothetical protein